MATVDLHELKVYQLAMRAGADVWSLTVGWDWLAQQTVGVQWIRAADAIAANISEGHGRGSAKENVRFCYYALGSLLQTRTWLEKAAERKLVIDSVARDLSTKFETLRHQLEGYIVSLDPSAPSQSNAVRGASSGGSIHLLPLEEFFLPRTDAWHN